MKTLLVTLLAAMVLLVEAPVAAARPVDSVHYFPSSGSAVINSASTKPSSSGTEWYVYALIGVGGLIVAGGVTYLVYTTTHRSGPHRPVGVQ
jgi:hypothetical protein